MPRLSVQQVEAVSAAPWLDKALMRTGATLAPIAGRLTAEETVHVLAAHGLAPYGRLRFHA